MSVPGKHHVEEMKNRLSEMFHRYTNEAYLDIPGMKQVDSPVTIMRETQALAADLAEHLKVDPAHPITNGESTKMLQQRWARLQKNFYNPKRDCYDTTKIPDIFDYITYDVIHNRKALSAHDLYGLLERAEMMARVLIPAEYGIYPKDKFMISSLICQPLAVKIFQDMKQIYGKSPNEKGSLFRLYFGSESHIHTLRNILLHSEIADFRKLVEPVEINYLAHFVFKLYENMDVVESDPARFQIEVLWSSGSAANPFGAKAENHILPILPMVSVNPFLTLNQMEQIVDQTTKVKKGLLQQMGSYNQIVHPDLAEK